MKKAIAVLAAFLFVFPLFSCSGNGKENSVLIYSSAEEYRNEYFTKRLEEQFPDYDIKLEYFPSGTQASKLLAEGKDTACDISIELEYGYVDKLEHTLADLSAYDTSMFMDDMILSNKVIPSLRNGGCIAVNTKLLEEKGLPVPTSYQDLLDPKYEGLISMPDPSSSGTGYMFLKQLVNLWGEEEAFAYFDSLKNNIKQFTSSGSGPVNALIMKEAAIGFAITAQAVTEINQGADLEILYFENGSPYSCYGIAMIEGKQDKKAVSEVFDFFYNTLIEEDKQNFFPEKIYKEKDFVIENYPQDIQYADMSNNTSAEKERLQEKWKNQ